MSGWSHDVRDYFSTHSWAWPAAIGAGLLVLLVLGTALTRSARRAGREKVISSLINVAALMATAVQASGMWKFFGNTMGLPVGFRIFMFSFMEIALLACGLRARANVEQGGDAGIDGVLVWVLALASGLMSSTDANTVREGLMRVLVSVVVALLWTRDLMAAKQGARKAVGAGRPDEKVRWRFSVGALGVKLRLADPGNHGIKDRDANRRIDNYVLAAHTANRDGAGSWSQRRKARAHAKLMRHARLHADPSYLMGLLGKAAFDEALELLGIQPEPGSAVTSKAGTAQGRSAAGGIGGVGAAGFAAGPEAAGGSGMPRRQVVFGDRAEAAEALRILMANGAEGGTAGHAGAGHPPAPRHVVQSGHPGAAPTNGIPTGPGVAAVAVPAAATGAVAPGTPNTETPRTQPATDAGNVRADAAPQPAADAQWPADPTSAAAQNAANRPAGAPNQVVFLPGPRASAGHDEDQPTEIISRRPIEEVFAEMEIFGQSDEPAPSRRSQMFAALDELHSTGDDRVHARAARNDAAREVARRIGGPTSDRTVTKYAQEWARAKGLEQAEVS